MTQTVLLAGATGMLGSQVACQPLEQPNVRPRLLVRGGDTRRAPERAIMVPPPARLAAR